MGKDDQDFYDTALRDIKDLVKKGILQQTCDKGRSTNYKTVDFINNKQ